MSKDLRFHDKTILSTPNPVHSSSMMASKSQKKPNISLMNDIPERRDSDDFMGTLSFNSDQSLFRMSDAGQLRERAKQQALNSLKEFDTKNINLTSIPSRFLKRNDMTESPSQTQFNSSESTISETDLIPGNYSTPRGSLVQEEFVMRDRRSISKSIQSFMNSLTNPNFNMADVYNEFKKCTNMDLGEESFQSGTFAVAKLEEDEQLWKEENDLPTACNDFSVDPVKNPSLSMGSFFIKKSDDLPTIFAKSPEKTQRPVALIETSPAAQSCNSPDKYSMDLSDIQKILTDQPTYRALDVFLNAAKSSSGEISDSKKPPSNYSVDDEAKENISPEIPKSILSSRSSSSLSSLPNGKLPIATTKSEIIWGCMKLGKAHSQDFIIRNRSANRLGIQCAVSNPSFRINKDGSETNYTNILKIVLHPYESRCLTVTFSPTSLGAAVDNLDFVSTDFSQEHTVKQFIRLYGYGGFGAISFLEMIKDTAGKFILSLGNIDQQHNLRKTFMVKNSGPLPTFTCFDFISNNLYAISNVEVSPQTCILLSGETAEVAVSYHLLKKDFYYFKSTVRGCVIDVGKLQVYYGTEVNRARLRKVCQRAKEKDIQIHSCLLKVIGKLPGEVIPADLKYFKESSASLDEVLKLLHKEDITVTLEQDIDLTVNENFQDETAMFQSLCEISAMDRPEASKDCCHVEPTNIILTPPDKVRDRIFVTNNHSKQVYFEVKGAPEYLYLKPREGTIKTGDTLAIDLIYVKQCLDKTVFKLSILVDNECFEVDVKIMYVKYK